MTWHDVTLASTLFLKHFDAVEYVNTGVRQRLHLKYNVTNVYNVYLLFC